MKIVGQSTLANGTPYIHLGYIAATYMKPNMALLSGGLVALTLGVAMAFSLVISKTVSGRTAFNFVRRRSKKLMMGGITLIVLGGIAMALAVTYNEKRHIYPFDITHANARRILMAMAERQGLGQPLPDDLAGLDLSSDVRTDGWMHPMRLVTTDMGGLKGYSILSAGPDESFGTVDDIRISSRVDGQFPIDNNSRPSAEGQ